MRKLIILIISIVITIAGTALIGVYDYNVWYNPEGKNSTQLQSDYKTYLIEKTVEIEGKEEIQKTESRIKLYRLLENYLYSEEPIFKYVKTENGVELFTIAVYKNVFWKLNSENQKEFDHYRYEVFLYDVNYTAIKNLFKQMIVPEDDTIVDKADDPQFVVNFFPTSDYDMEDALIDDSTYNATYKTTLYDGETLMGYTMGNTTTINLFDYGSEPQKNKDDDVYYVRSFIFYDYTFDTNADKFDEGFIKVDALLPTNQADETIYYTLDESLVKEKVETFTFDGDKIKEEDYLKGFISDQGARKTLNNVDIDGVLSYDGWVFAKYLWWQCLIAFVVFGLLMTGFYFTFTYEEKGTTKIKRKKQVNKKKK